MGRCGSGSGETTCEYGGLEIGNLRTRNRVLLAKWLWRFTLEPEALWHNIVASKHGNHPFDWVEKGLKTHTKTLGKIYRSSFLPFLIL